ncbi:hypothetical protein [Maribacter sp. 2308TA10-17]|uniref:hypothetical protein n=1 Tax=Maribacter sp. 2308TA10-17 TaxID=3386276 RepID=UPI0039BC73AB
MNTILIIANLLVLFTFIIHTFGGDKNLKAIEPEQDSPKRLRIFWTMSRGAFHIVSIDFLFATIGLALINFTDYFQESKLLLNLLALYFLGYGIAFLLTLIISKKFSNIYFKMWQWLLMLVIAGLIYWGNS